MPSVTKTIGPLHFEDLEPHRFEDLVRQLAYGFRTWRVLEATGRLGNDDGMDMRGVELVGESPEGEDGSDEGGEAQAPLERVWVFQCKRAKEIEPKDAAKIVAEAVPDSAQAPYGLVVAVACDVSKKTLAVMRAQSTERKVEELHVWTRAHLEDLLFRPENDHLLFAYFGISLRLRRQSRLREIREPMVTRRKVLRSLGLASYSENAFKSVIVRDVLDRSYPDIAKDAGARPPRLLSWEVTSFEEFYADGVLLTRFRGEGWVKEDGTWDFFRPSVRRETLMGAGPLDFWSDEAKQERELLAKAREEESKAFAKVPNGERQHIRFQYFLPFSAIVEVDQLGDPRHECPHFYCQYEGSKGPYVGSLLVRSPDRVLEPTNQRSLFELSAKAADPPPRSEERTPQDAKAVEAPKKGKAGRV